MRPPTLVFALLALSVPARAAQEVLLQEAKLHASTPAGGQSFGGRVALEGERALVGTFFTNTAYLFERSGTTWTEVQRFAPPDGPALGGAFGRGVSLSADTLAIGAESDGQVANGAGAVYVFVRNGATWSQQAKLFGSATTVSSLGTDVELQGETLLAGAYRQDNLRGAAYVFVRSGTTWSEQALLVAADGVAGDQFGFRVALDGDTAAVGAHVHGGTGAVYVFVRSGGSWSHQQTLAAGGGGAQFGSDVALEGDVLVVGAQLDFPGSQGRAYVFRRSGTLWSQEAILGQTDGSGYFGSAVALRGERALIGAPNDPSAANIAGAAYLFERRAGTWSMAQQWWAADTATPDALGVDVALDGDTAVIGAAYDQDFGGDSGSAYVLRLIPAVAEICPGDGSSAPCPCGNSGATDHGCDNAQGTGGVLLSVQGYSSSAPGSGMATLVGTGYPSAASPTAIGLRSGALEPVPVSFGDGLRCLSVAGLVRFGAASASAGSSQHVLNHGAGAGTFHYQLWYRNTPASFCDATAAFNLSSGLTVLWP